MTFFLLSEAGAKAYKLMEEIGKNVLPGLNLPLGP